MAALDLGDSPAISTYNDGQPTSTWTDPATRPTGMLVSMISALDATMAATNPEYTRPPLALADNPIATANALSVLFEALPSAAAIAIAAKYNLRPETVAPQPTNTELQPTPQILLLSTSGTSSAEARSTSITSSTATSSSSSSTSSTFSSSTTSSQSSTLPPSATRSLQPVFTSKPPTNDHIQNRAIAGIVSGVLAALVILILLLIFLLRRRSQGKKPFEHKKIYPEVAWLYDPAPTPQATMHKRHDSGEATLLQPREEEMEQVRAGSPERTSALVTSPLLPPPARTFAGGGDDVEDDRPADAWWQGGTTIRTVRRSSASGMLPPPQSRPASEIFLEPHAM